MEVERMDKFEKLFKDLDEGKLGSFSFFVFIIFKRI